MVCCCYCPDLSLNGLVFFLKLKKGDYATIVSSVCVSCLLHHVYAMKFHSYMYFHKDWSVPLTNLIAQVLVSTIENSIFYASSLYPKGQTGPFFVTSTVNII